MSTDQSPDPQRSAVRGYWWWVALSVTLMGMIAMVLLLIDPWSQGTSNGPPREKQAPAASLWPVALAVSGLGAMACVVLAVLRNREHPW